MKGGLRARTAGFTLMELMIALSIVGVLLAIAFGGLRMGIVAWSRGEERAEVQQHDRGLSQIVVRTLGATYPYRGPLGDAPEKRLLFRGEEQRIELVSQTPAFPSPIPTAFTAVVLALEDDAQGRALVVRQRLLPNREPFTKATVVLRDPMIQGLEFSYLSAEGTWADTWDADNEKKLPSAIRVRFATMRGDRLQRSPPITVNLHTTGAQQ